VDAAERAAPELIDRAPESTAALETPVYFEAGDDVLLGVLTRPSVRSLNVALISAAGGLRGTSMGRNRMMVRLARQAGGRGFHAFRFDYHGVGESTGPIESFSLDAPYVQDLEAAARTVEGFGVERHVYAGICFGARTVMSLVPSREGVAGVALVEPPIRDGLRQGRKLTRYGNRQLMRVALRPWVLAGLLKKEQRAYYAKFVKAKLHAARTKDESREETDLSWVSEDYLGTLQRLVDRGVPVLLVYGDGSENYREFLRAQTGRLGELMSSAGDGIEIVTLPGQIHGFSDLLSQQRVIDTIEGWATGLFADGDGPPEDLGGEDGA
jgi:pimeloyl-ACP methyl ester carboxylesterase